MLILASVISCEADFEINKLDAEPMFYIESIFFDEQELIEISVKNMKFKEYVKLYEGN